MPRDGAELEPFRCEVQPDRNGIRVRPVGELDLATVPAVEAELAELWAVGFTHFVFDLRAVRFLDSTGVRLLWSWHAQSSTDGIVFEVIPGPPVVQRALELTGIANRLTYRSQDGHGPAAASREGPPQANESASR
jgi:anti-sigma B factor antagonist